MDARKQQTKSQTIEMFIQKTTVDWRIRFPTYRELMDYNHVCNEDMVKNN